MKLYYRTQSKVRKNEGDDSDEAVIDTDFDMTWRQDSEPDDDETPTGVFVADIDKSDIFREEKCITFNYLLIDVVKKAFGARCTKGDSQILYEWSMRGSCMVIKYRCQNPACFVAGTWSSQPRIRYMYACNLLLPACIAMSGNNYTKIALMAKFMKVGFVSKFNYHRYTD